ncbi:hypothetical protein cyc_03197 [Cyclospora cayetanensis]|uniref:Uncharacterized protein n=1 Tax=Cyclospora cayetanensis TaxID=88456 RepID=A0A1D3D9M3_9EIME|nr:hypothetical protein cyc_03197 [Cyclospora cayetanensis]
MTRSDTQRRGDCVPNGAVACKQKKKCLPHRLACCWGARRQLSVNPKRSSPEGTTAMEGRRRVKEKGLDPTRITDSVAADSTAPGGLL